MRVFILTSYAGDNDPRVKNQEKMLRANATQVHRESLFGAATDQSARLSKSSVLTRVTHQSASISSAKRLLDYRRAIQRIKRKVMMFDPDIIIAHEIEAFAALARLAADLSAPIVWDAHEWYEDQRGTESGRAKWVKRILSEHADKAKLVTTVSPELAELYRTRFPAPIPIEFIPNLSRISSAQKSGLLHRRANLAPDIKVLLFHGGLGRGRGLEDLAACSDEFPDHWHVVFIGSGACAEELSNFRNCTVLSEVAHEEIQKYVPDAALGALLYSGGRINHKFGLPNKLWEFSFAAVPVIASDLPSLRHIITQYGLGYLVESASDTQSVLDVLKRVDASDSIAFAEGLNIFRHEFNPEKFDAIYMEHLERISKAARSIS